MQISEALTKKIMETSYLTAINADRYRVILRYFYEEYEKIHYWLNKEDVFDMMLKIGLFPDSTLNQCQLDLQAQFQNHRIVLQDYLPSYRSVLPEELADIPDRLELLARIQGRRAGFQELVDYIGGAIAELQQLIQEQERTLFEDIMINSITKTIRRHIRTSREWVQRMNTAMSAMNTSSALRLSLQWKGRKAKNDQELDSRELITLLETDAQIMKPQDQQRLAGHFRNRLAAARKEAEKEENQ